MRAKLIIVDCILILALTGAGTNFAHSAVTTSSTPTVKRNPSPWLSIPEDSAPWRREPFKDAEPSQNTGPAKKPGAAGTLSDLALQGIMKSNKHFYAIINGRTVKTGNHIEGWSVSEISRYRVILRREKETQIYDIYQGRIDRGNR
jgi:hypothetical protein